MRFSFFFSILCIAFTIQVLCPSCSGTDKKVVRVSDYGLHPDTKENAIPIISTILEENRHIDTLVILFDKGRYDFWSEGVSSGSKDATIAVKLDGMKNVTIDGNKANFIYHGRVMPFSLQDGENITLKNFSIDWERPYNSQVTIVEATDDYVDVKIDKNEYPYEIVNDSIYFLGEGWRSPITPDYTNLYHKDTKDILYQTRDHALGMDLYSAKVSRVDDNRVRFHFKPLIKPDAGTYIVFFHGTYIVDGISVRSCKNTQLQNIDIYHTLSCGVVAYKNKNIYLNNVNIITNDEKDRAFSTVADATHFNGNMGEIVFDGCAVKGAGDDFMNIHGMYAKVREINDKRKVTVEPIGRYIGFEPGEITWCVDGKTLQRNHEIEVRNQETLMENDKIAGYLITFAEDIEGRIKVGDVLENKDKTASLTVRNCKMYKKNRARSILATTPKNILIENNYFNSAGAAIMIEGDTQMWFESGAVCNVVIRNNIFEDCYTSGNNIIDKPWGWGEAIITISPSVQPDNIDFPAYHSNITIKDNIFKHYDYAILFARSVKNLTFEKNELYKTNTYEPFYRKVNFYLDGCRDVSIKDNYFSDDFPGKNIFIKNMRLDDVKQSGDDKLEILTKDIK